MRRVLFVEDDIDVRTVFEHVLFDAGYEVDSTQTMAGGKELLCCRDYDILVTDGRLPDGTGIQLADEAQKPSIPAIVMTGYAFVLRELGAEPEKYNVLLKPVRSAELLAAIDNALVDQPNSSAKS